MKERVIGEHTEKMMEINDNILKVLQNTTTDKHRKLEIGCTIPILDKLKALAKFESTRSSEMSGEQRVETMRVLLSHAQETMKIISKHGGHDSIMDDISKQIELYNKELDLVNDEIKNTTDEYERLKLEEKKKGIIYKT